MNRFTMFKVNDLGLANVTVTNTNDIHLMKKIIPYCWNVWMKKIYQFMNNFNNGEIGSHKED